MDDVPLSIDLNGDVGEGFETDAEFIPLLTSVNVACGAHAGDEASMHQAVSLANEYQIRIGAHPGFQDREHFGRREIILSKDEIIELILSQLNRLQSVCEDHQTEVSHLKLHGALYHQASTDEGVAMSVIEAIRQFQAPIEFVIGQPGTLFERLVKQAGLRFVAEAFVDRAYDQKGQLIPRSDPMAIIQNPEHAVRQAVRIVTEQSVLASNSASDTPRDVPLEAETLCLHGDHAGSIEFAKRVREALMAKNILIRAFQR